MEYTKIEIYTNEELNGHEFTPYNRIIEKIKELKIAARCMVYRGIAGCYENGEIASHGIEILSMNMPLKIDIVFPSGELDYVLEGIKDLEPGGIVVIGKVNIFSHRTRKKFLPSHLKVQDVMTESPRALLSGGSALDAIRTLLGASFNALPVIDKEGVPIGIITQGDLISRLGIPVRIGILRELEKEKVYEVIVEHRNKCVNEIMSSPLYSVSEDMNLENAVKIMLGNKLKRLPVTGKNGTLTGMLSRIDVFRTMAYENPDWKKFHEYNIETEALLYVKDIMDREIKTVPPEEKVEDLVKQINFITMSRIAVVDKDGFLQGIITDKDLLLTLMDAESGLFKHLINKLSFSELHKHYPNISKLKASDCMQIDLVTIREDALIDDAVKLMTEHAIKRLPVLNQEGKFKGMISRNSILKHGVIGKNDLQ